MLLRNTLQSENRIATQRRFNRVSEDVISGSKAMIVRRQLRDLDIYNDNLSAAKALFDAAEKNLTFIAHDKYISVEERLTAAANGTHDQQELNIYATDLDQIAEAMVTTLNGDISERQIFGGTSNGGTPFRIQKVKIEDKDGNVVFPPQYNKYYNADGTVRDGVQYSDIPRIITYNGVPLDFDVTTEMIMPDGTFKQTADGDSYTISYLDEKTMKWSDETQEISAEDISEAIEKKDNSLIYPGSKPILVDIGLGIKYDENYEIDPQTAMDIALNGAKITGSGIDNSKAKVAYEYNVNKDLSKGYPDTVTMTIGGTALTLEVPPKELEEEYPELFDEFRKYKDGNITVAYNMAIQKALRDNGMSDKNVEFTYSDGKITVTSGEKLEVECPDLGIDETGRSIAVTDSYSKNLLQLVIDASDALKRGDQSTVNAIIDRAKNANNHVLTEITTIGARQNSIDFYIQKNEDYDYILKERQNIVEGTDMESEEMRYSALKAAYDATLKMGSMTLPHSIFDFI